MADKKVIAGSDITAQQMKEFWSQVALEKINRKNLQEFLGRPRYSLLKPLGEVTLFIPKYRILSEYFTEKRFILDKNFGKFILPNLYHSVSGVETKMKSFSLIQSGKMKDVCSELPKGYIFENIPQLFTCIADMIEYQKNDHDSRGDLVTTDFACNTFFVRYDRGKILYILVRRDVALLSLKKWDISVARYDDNERYNITPYTPHRIFSASVGK